MKNLQEKIDNWKIENNFDYSTESEEEFFEWLQINEFPECDIEYNGISGYYHPRKWYTITTETESQDFYL